MKPLFNTLFSGISQTQSEANDHIHLAKASIATLMAETPSANAETAVAAEAGTGMTTPLARLGNVMGALDSVFLTAIVEIEGM